ncbi:MAG: RHS repeat-associated core domain-containing protein, partial [Kofleriaceae bacterium]
GGACHALASWSGVGDFGNDDIKQLTHSLGTSAKVFNYTYDARHQLTQALSTTAGYFSASYAYGAAGRLGGVNESSAASPGSDISPRNVAYEYTGADPEQITRLRNVSGGTTYTSYTYDTAGNETTRCVGGPTTACSGVKTEFVYDGNNRIRRATRKVNGVIQSSEEYWYNANGSRQNVIKRNGVGAIQELVWYISGTEAHYNSSGSTTLAYAHVSMGATVARIARDSSTLPILEYQFEGMGNSTLATVDQATGTANTIFSYAPFGEVIEAVDGGGAAGGLTAHNRRFDDKVIDSVSDLTYYGGRYYDRYVHSWTQADPLHRFLPDASILSPRRSMLYVTDLNNPLRYRDPDGFEPGFQAAVKGMMTTAPVETAHTSLPHVSEMMTGFEELRQAAQENRENRGDCICLGQRVENGAKAVMSAPRTIGGITFLFFNALDDGGVRSSSPKAASSDDPDHPPDRSLTVLGMGAGGGGGGGGGGFGIPTKGMGGRVLTASEQAEFAAQAEKATAAGLVENPSRTGSWGKMVNGKFKEVQRMDVGEEGEAGWGGKTHVHNSGEKTHLPPETPIPDDPIPDDSSPE